MKNFYKLCTIGLMLISLTGCMTFSGDKLANLEPITPIISPVMEESVGDFTFHLDGGKMVTSNKAGRLINDTILERWKKNDYISEFTYVKTENFTGNAQYNLTLKGHQEGKSSVAMQVLSGLTLFLIPHSVETSYDLIYELEEVKTGKKYTVEAAESMKTTNWLLFLPAFPFSFIGANNTYKHIAEHVYQEFVKQGAFSNIENTSDTEFNASDRDGALEN